MQEFYNYKRYKVIYVDDEALSLKYFARNLEGTFDILTAKNAAEGLRLVEEHGDQVGIIVTDQRMPEGTGVAFLEKARALQPRTIRILATAYSDLDAIIQAVNNGSIYKYVTKPFDYAGLEITLKRAMEFFILQNERDQLLREKMGSIHRMMMTDRLLGLGVMASGLGHHLRNSLVAVKAFLDLAPSKLAEEQIDPLRLRDPEYWNEFYGQAQQQLRKIVEFLKTIDGCVAEPSLPLNDTVDLTETIGEARTRHQKAFQARNISVDIHADESLPPIKGNAMLLLEVFASLLHEQASLLPEGGRITIKLSKEKAPGTGTQRLLVEFSDTGPGFPEDALFKLFDPFYIKSSAPSDFAVGLLSCFFMVYHHGGTLETLSGSSHNYRFRVHLPVDATVGSAAEDEQAFLRRVFEVESMWERLLIQP
jgi:two-component system probable response regulator PhcQ